MEHPGTECRLENPGRGRAHQAIGLFRHAAIKVPDSCFNVGHWNAEVRSYQRRRHGRIYVVGHQDQIRPPFR